MKELPLIDTSFPLFDWTISNGTATAEQTAAAFNAVSSQGQTADFSRLVWNDLVDKLNNALTAAGIVWDSKYTTADGAKVTAQYGAFTAEMFNSIRHNIGHLINTNWPWTYDVNRKGYLGREDVRGVGQYGASGSDYVYGWYIIELARVLNVLITILKNEADFAELGYRESLMTLTDVNLFSAKAAHLKYCQPISSKIDANLFPAKAGHLQAESIIRSSANTALTKVRTIRVNAQENSFSKLQGSMEKLPVTRMEYKGTSSTMHQAELRSIIYAARMQHKTIIKSLYQAELLFMGSLEIKAQEISKTLIEAELRKIERLCVNAQIMAMSNYEAELVQRRSLRLSGDALAESVCEADLLQRAALKLYGQTTGKSQQSAQLIRRPPKRVYARAFGESLCLAEVVPAKALPVEVKCCSETETEAELSPVPPDYLSAQAVAESVSRADIVPVDSIGLKVVSKTESTSLVDLEMGIGIGLQTSDTAVSGTHAGLAKAQVSRMGHRGATKTKNKASLYTGSVKALAAAIRTMSNCYAVLSFDGVEDDWLEPIQRGTNLYIRQVYRFWSENGRNYVDIDHYIPPVQEGSNLYIQQDIIGGE